MENFRSQTLKNVYNPGLRGDDVLGDFFVPTLRNSIAYERVAGYFSSTVIASAARGIAGLVENGGKIRLVTSHAFTPSDHLTLGKIIDEEAFAESLMAEFEENLSTSSGMAGAFGKNHLAAMCWLLANELLEIRVVVPSNSKEIDDPRSIDLFHPKFGILQDQDGDEVVFAGSLNESTNGWLRNAENLSVYRSWVDGQEGYVLDYKESFRKYWENDGLDGWTCIALPDAVKSRLVKDFAPADKPDFANLDLEESSPDAEDGLRNYQRDAVNKWVASNYVGTLMMATGSGKTRTAKACIRQAETLGSLLTVVVAPYQHICDQWSAELAELNPIEIQGSGWRAALNEKRNSAKMGRLPKLTLITVKNTASSKDFIDVLNDLREFFDHFLFIGDEVHWLGATTFQKSLNENADLRLGLSATPQRYFDPEGTEVLQKYFGGEPIFEFSLRDALNWKLPDGSFVLCPYMYTPVFVDLTMEESLKYGAFSRRIATLMSIKKKTQAIREEIEMLRIQRAAIAKSAAEKVPKLDELLDQFKEPLTQCIIYCSDTTQMTSVAEVLNSKGIFFQKITGEEGARSQTKYGNKSEREFYIENFARGQLDVLLAIDCLDEGVDIPSAEMGIILASSGNSKEFIQRRGRLMRNFPGKEFAKIYDFVVLPEDDSSAGPADALRKIEIKRILEFAEDAMNEEQIVETISHLL
jgi:superfamily II DNA or RNA helicase